MTLHKTVVFSRFSSGILLVFPNVVSPIAIPFIHFSIKMIRQALFSSGGSRRQFNAPDPLNLDFQQNTLPFRLRNPLKVNPFLFILILLSLTHLAFAQDTSIETTVCTQDADGITPLDGAIVLAQLGNLSPVAGTTGSDGCVTLTLQASLPTDIEDENQLPGGFRVGAPYPNPARDEFRVPVRIGEGQQVQIALYDVRGRSVMPAFSSYAPPGDHQINLDIEGLYPGLYVYRITGERGVSSGKVMKLQSGSGAEPHASLSAGSGAIERVPTARSSQNSSPKAFAVRIDAARQGYLTARIDKDIAHREQVVLLMSRLAPGVPSAPLPDAPANTAVGVPESEVVLEWNGDELASTFAVQLSTTESFSSVDFQQEQIEGTTTAVSSLHPATTYFWRVQAVGDMGASEWSLVYQFTTLDGALPVPGVSNLQTPQNGAVDVALPDVTFDWGQASDATQYRIQVATTSSFTTPLVDVSGLSTTGYTASTLGNGTQYFWRVSASGEGGTGDWSEVFEFTTSAEGGSQAAPTLQSPADGASGVETTLDLEWSEAAGATSYAVQVSQNADFSNLVADVSGLLGTSHNVSGLLTGKSYYWRVQADGLDGTSDWSTVFSFSTASSTSAPPAPDLIAPIDGAADISSGSVSFSWSSADGADSYDVQLSTSSNFNSIENEESGVENTTVVMSGLSANTSYFWRARSTGEGGTSDWSDANAFSTGEGGSSNEMIALDLMGPGDTYYGLHGGLVDNGVPGVTATNGKIVIIAVSMSNGFQEFDRFIELYEGHADVSTQVELVNCAVGGMALERWVDGDGAQDLWDGCKSKVTKKHSLDQVKVVWAKNADMFTADGITLPDPQADYYDLVTNIGLLGQRIGQEFPSVQAVFNSSRIYGGYVEEKKQAARGEPISYEGGFAINTVIEKWQRGELPGSPWMGWGPYIWASGLTPNGTGIFWDRSDFQGDNGENQHPSAAGAKKVADALHEHFMQFGWYRN